MDLPAHCARAVLSPLLFIWPLLMAPLLANGQSHLELVSQTPCLEEYRAWIYTFRRAPVFTPPSQFTAEACALAAAVHERIEAEQAEAALILSEHARARDADEQVIPCLQEFRVWQALHGSRQSLESGLSTFVPFKLYNRQECVSASQINERITVRKRERAKREQAARAQREAFARRPTPRIGMSRDEVVNATNWGKPLSIRRTTSASVVREQWIYGDKHYLYFENGKLTAIQD